MMDALVRFNLATCAHQRAKAAVIDGDWERLCREMESWQMWMEHGTVEVTRATYLAARAHHAGWMEGFHTAENIFNESTKTYVESY